MVPKKDVQKLVARSREALMMGYSSQIKGHKLWDADARKFVVSRDVTFNESSNNQNADTAADVTTSPELIGDPLVKIDPTSSHNTNVDTSDSEIDSVNVQAAQSASEDNLPSATDLPAASVPAPTPRRSERITRKPGPWWIAKPSSNSNSSPTPDVSLLATCCDSLAEVALLAPEIPNTYDAAMSPDSKAFWEPGIKKEEDSIRENNMFELVERKSNMNVIPCRYVFRVKKDVGPNVRIVAKGFRQVPGVHPRHWIITRLMPLLYPRRLCDCFCVW